MQRSWCIRKQGKDKKNQNGTNCRKDEKRFPSSSSFLPFLSCVCIMLSAKEKKTTRVCSVCIFFPSFFPCVYVIKLLFSFCVIHTSSSSTTLGGSPSSFLLFFSSFCDWSEEEEETAKERSPLSLSPLPFVVFFLCGLEKQERKNCCCGREKRSSNERRKKGGPDESRKRTCRRERKKQGRKKEGEEQKFTIIFA